MDPFLGDIDAQSEATEFASWHIGHKRVGFYACEGEQDLLSARWYWLKSLSGTRCHGDVTITASRWRSQNIYWFEKPGRWRDLRSARDSERVCRRVPRRFFRVFNAGFDPDGEFPCQILLNTAKHEAVWRHPYGHECIRPDPFSRPFFPNPKTTLMNTIQLTQNDCNTLMELLARQPGSTEDEETRQGALLSELLRADILPEAEIVPDVITLRRRARLVELESGDVLDYTLVLPQEADVSAGSISILAPLGTAMPGFRRGDVLSGPCLAGG